jgi:hypothetical protein
VIVDHYISANHTTRVPRRWVWLDAEAHEHETDTGAVQTWRLAVTCFERNDTDNKHWTRPQWQTHRDPASLWAYVDKCTRRRARTVVVAHNLGYDLRITRALDLLPALGWTVYRLAVHERSISLTLRKDGRSLVLTDSMGWLPMGLEKVGGLIGERKCDLPAFSDSDDVWEERCRQDVVILREAMRDLLDWVESGDLGNWQKTGAGQAWSHWRHAHYTHRVLVHSDEVAREHEVAAMHTARCEAWRHGTLPGRLWEEWDLPLAYPMAARDLNLPTALRAYRTSPPWSWVRKAARTRRVLVRAAVTTKAPTLPVHDDGRTLWPVGQFVGTWWESELELAMEHGAKVTPLNAWTYLAAPALASWASWVVAAATDPTVTGSLVRMAAAKHMSRALIGKFAVRWTPWEEWSELPYECAPLETVYDGESGEAGKVLTIGSLSWVGWQRRYGADALPAITGAVMAEVRIRLWRAMQAAGPENVAYCDTDSVIVNRAGAARLRKWTEAGNGWGLRRKDTHMRVHILGPRQLIIDDSTRIAGVPKSAVWASRQTMTGRVWESVEAALGKGHTGEVVLRSAQWKVKGADRRREHLPRGKTAALSLVSDAVSLRGA